MVRELHKEQEVLVVRQYKAGSFVTDICRIIMV